MLHAMDYNKCNFFNYRLHISKNVSGRGYLSIPTAHEGSKECVKWMSLNECKNEKSPVYIYDSVDQSPAVIRNK